MSAWKSDEKLRIFALFISPSKSFCFFAFDAAFHRQLKPSKFVKNTPLRVVFSTLFSVFLLVMKHCVSCLIYYFCRVK